MSYGKKKVVTPQLAPSRMKFDGELAQAVTGLSLTKKEMKDALRRSRLDLDAKGFAVIPSYRVDILHQVDLAEEVVIGYGLDKMTASYPPERRRRPGSTRRPPSWRACASRWPRRASTRR